MKESEAVNNTSSTTRNAFTLMIGTLASRITGLFRTSLLIQLFSKEITDAFLVAFKVPNLFRELLAEGALTNSFVPIYKTLSSQAAKKLSGALLGLLIIINTLLLLLVYVSAPWLVDLLIANRANVNYELALRLTRIVFPFLAAISLSALVMGILQAEERFLAPAWAPVALNIVTISLMLIYPQQAVMLAVAFVLGGVAQLLFQVPALLRWGVLPKVTGLWHPKLAGVLLLMVPFAFTTGGRQILNVVANRVLTTISAGSVTAFANADLFLSLALGLFSISPALAFYSRLSDNAANQPESFPLTLLSGLRLIAFLIAPAGLMMFVLAEPAIETVFNWMTFFGNPGADEEVIRLSILTLAPLGLAAFPLGLNNLLIRTFYVRQRVRTPIFITLIFLSLHMFLYVVLAESYGIQGMSWATVIVAWLQFILLLALVARNEGIKLADFSVHTLKVWLASLGAVLLMILLANGIPFSENWLGFFLEAVTGVVVIAGAYLGLCVVLGVKEVRLLLDRI